jgi:hypothetical protein
MSTTAQTATSKIADFDAITAVMNLYTQGVRTGSSAAMKPAFHDAATFFGYYQGNLLAGPIQMLFDWVDGNGPSERLQTRVTSVDMCETIAIVTVDMANMTGKLTGEGPATLSDRFQLIKVGGEWKISQKSFHWF